MKEESPEKQQISDKTKPYQNLTILHFIYIERVSHQPRTTGKTSKFVYSQTYASLLAARPRLSTICSLRSS
eukprot:6176371-Pleurochrysis_carterae.AAC.1